jgi:HAD superfamily hydrolase (TIGR01509 family)
MTGQEPRAVIFDIDGTLLDSVDAHARSWVDAFGEFGHRLAFEEVRRQIGKGGDQLMPVFLSEAEIARTGKALEQRRGEIFRTVYLPGLKPFPGVRALFQRLLADGRKIALASSATAREISIYARMVHVDDLIDAKTSSDDAENSKPQPDIFEAALRRLGMEPERAVAIGDTPYDAEAAGKAGIRTIGVLCGGWSADELCAAGCIAAYRDVEHLLADYETSPLVR